MDRIDRDRALFLGVCALQDYVEQARDNAVPGTIQLRAMLALVALHGKGDLRAYREFWEWVRKETPPDHDHHQIEEYIRATRSQTMWIGIARDLGFPAVSVAFHHKVGEFVRQARGEKPATPAATKPKRDCG